MTVDLDAGKALRMVAPAGNAREAGRHCTAKVLARWFAKKQPVFRQLRKGCQPARKIFLAPLKGQRWRRRAGSAVHRHDEDRGRGLVSVRHASERTAAEHAPQAGRLEKRSQRIAIDFRVSGLEKMASAFGLMKEKKLR